MNALKEIDLLQDIAKPTHRLITNVAAAHLEGLGSIENVAKAKGELFDGARQNDVVFVNMDDDLIIQRPIPEGVQKFCWETSKCTDSTSTCRIQDNQTYMEILVQETQVVHSLLLPSPGLHLAQNATLAFAVGLSMGANHNI